MLACSANVSKSDANLIRKESENDPEIGMRAKWQCCGKAFHELECPNRRHTPVRHVETLGAMPEGHPQLAAGRWWCNRCCNSASTQSCMHSE